MIPLDHLEYAKTNIPEYGGDEVTFLDRFLTYGLTLPVPEVPAPQYHLPGRVVADLGPIAEPRGPSGRNCKFLFIAVAPDLQDYQCQQHFASQGPSSLLRDGLRNAGFNLAECYFTTVMRFPRPMNASSYKQCWLRQGWSYIEEEIVRLHPDAICLLGSEPLKCHLGNKAVLESVRGQVFQFEMQRWRCPAMAIQSHMNFVANTAGFPAFVRQLCMFKDILTPEGAKVLTGTEYPDRDYQILDTPEKIAAAVDEEIRAGTHTIAIDVETATDTGRPDHTYLISFQWSSRPGHARIIPLLVERSEPILDVNGTPVPLYGGAGVDRKSINDRVFWWDLAREQILRLLEAVKRLAGHNIRYDLIGLRDEFQFDIRKYIRRGIFDTMQAYHALEKDEYGLKQLTLRFTDMGAYDAPMYDWIARNSGPGKLFSGAKEDRFFHGFRDICYKYLLQYAMCDTDATIRLVPIFEERFNLPGNEALKELFYGTLLPLNSPVIDIESTGLPVDYERATKLSHLYQRKYAELVEDFRLLIDWPEFNVNSPLQVPSLLYGGIYKNHQKCEATRADVPNAYRCNLTPPWETGKFGKNWEEIEPEEYLYHSPSCEAKALKKLLVSVKDMPEKTRKVLKALCEIKDMKQFVTLFMREPVTEAPASEEHPRYGKGLLGCILDTGRMRTQLSLLSETHRWKHRAPNLANLPKSKEDSVQTIFAAHATEEDEDEIVAIDDGAVEVNDGDTKIHVPKIRTMFQAAPGWKIIEADYKSAELWVMGMLSGDVKFCHVLNTEPDMHGYNAKQIFGLDCSVREVKKKYPQQRFAVKAVCLAEGTPVLTEKRGFVAIEQVTAQDRVWDGLEWVSHEGLIYKGVKEVIEVNGVWLTPDHKILTDEGMVPASQAVSTPHQLSARCSADGRLWVSNSENAGASSGSSSGATVVPNGSLTEIASPACSSGNPSSVARAVSPVRIARVYDLYNAGPRHRFQARELLCSNCFGLAYGLGAPGLADQLSLEFGRFVGTEEAQQIIDGYFEQYPGLRSFFETCKVEVEQKGYVETPFGSRRYFPGFAKIGRDKQAKMKREGMNSKIQGSVAIMLDKASVLLDEVRYDTDVGRKIGWEYVLAIHDAMYVHTPAWAADTTAGIVKWAMESIMIPGLNRGLQVDFDIIDRWGLDAG